MALAVLLALAMAAGAAAAPFPVAEINLEKALEGKGAIRVDAGLGVTLAFGPPEGEGLPVRKLEVVDGQNRVKGFDEAVMYEGLIRFRFGGADFWIISAFTGGAHCCGQYEFFSRPGADQPLRYLGATPGHNGGPLPLAPALLVKEGKLYFQDLDNRFDYFHESHAGSMLVNFPERYFLVAPDSLTVANTAFRDRYLAALPEVEKEIAKALRARRGKPQAILKQEYGSDFDATNFSDDLGQLLVKRTILLLYAREESRAWQTLDADVRRFYQTARWLPELKQDIQKQLAGMPY